MFNLVRSKEATSTSPRRTGNQYIAGPVIYALQRDPGVLKDKSLVCFVE